MHTDKGLDNGDCIVDVLAEYPSHLPCSLLSSIDAAESEARTVMGKGGMRTSSSSITATATFASFSTYGIPEASTRLATWREALRAGMVVGA